MFCSHVEHSPHSRCLVVLRRLRWFSAITHWRCFLTNQLWTAYCNSSGLPQWQIGHVPERNNSKMQRSCWWCILILWLEPQQGAWAAHSCTVKPLLVLKPHTMLGSSQLEPLPGIWPAIRVAAVSFLKWSLFIRAGGGVREETMASLKSGVLSSAFPEGNPMQMSRSFQVPCWKCHQVPTALSMAVAS